MVDFMAEKPKPDPKAESAPPRVTADFGGRRKILDRRRCKTATRKPERRTGKDRRSGFDRRGALTQNGDKKIDKRHDFNSLETINEELDNAVE